MDSSPWRTWALLALWCMCCTWWKPTHRRTTHLYITRWIYRRDIRCDRIHGMQDRSKESDESSQYDKLALPSSPKGEIVGIMIQVFSLMARWQIIVQQVSSKELMIRLQKWRKKSIYASSLYTKARIHAGLLIKRRICVCTHFDARKSAYMWESLFLGLWYLDLWFWSLVLCPKCWTQVLGP